MSIENRGLKKYAGETVATRRLDQEAWLGDAVLSLYARSKILREDGVLDGPKCVRMTSNRFLGTIGEPTKVEAEIGRVYANEGLAAAFAWIEARITQLFDRQEVKRARKSGMTRNG